MNPRYILLLTLLTLCACGFHLRGTRVAVTKSGVSAVAVKSLSAQDTANEVLAELRLGGTRIKDAGDRKAYLLSLRKESFNRTVLSVSADTGKVKEYELTLQVIMTLTAPGGKTLVNNETITASSDYTFDESSILGKSNEESTVRDDLIRQVAGQVIRRLNAEMQ